MTKTEEIMAAMKAALIGAGLNVPDLVIRDDTDAPHSFEDMPCIVLDCGDEYPDPVVGMGFVYWNLTVLLLVIAEGAIFGAAP
jgi:hypothetical protein